MSDEVEWGMISRRQMFSFLGLAAALGIAAPSMVLTASNAGAQTPGMERRDDRRTGRQDRRDDRRTGRVERREERHTKKKTKAKK